MVPTSAGIRVVERDHKNGCHQHLTSGGNPSCLLSLSEALQDKQVGLTQTPVKLLPLCWDLEQVSFCAHPLRAKSWYPTALWLSQT